MKMISAKNEGGGQQGGEAGAGYDYQEPPNTGDDVPF
jgi:hypothetical protein